MAFSLYFWPPSLIMVDFSLYCSPYLYTVGLLLIQYVLVAFSVYYWLTACLYGWPSPNTTPIMVGFLYSWPSSYTSYWTGGLLPILHVGLLPIYCWPSPYTVDLLPILVAFSPYYWSSPYTVGLLPILLAFSLYCWPSPYTVDLLPILLAFSLHCWPSPCAVGLLPILLAFSLYCWPSPRRACKARWKYRIQKCTCNSCTCTLYVKLYAHVHVLNCARTAYMFFVHTVLLSYSVYNVQNTCNMRCAVTIHVLVAVFTAG